MPGDGGNKLRRSVEQVERDRVAHRPIAAWRRVKRIAAVIGRGQAVGPCGVAGCCVEVYYRVEIAGLPDPGVNGLAVGFILGIGVIIIIADEGHDGRADRLDPFGAGAGDDLAIGTDDAGDMGLMRGGADRGFAGERAEIVDPFQQDEMGDAGLRQHVAVEPGKCVGTKAIVEQPIAADPLIDDRDVATLRVGLQAFGQPVGPAIIAVGSAVFAVGDRVAQRDDDLGGGAAFDFECGEVEPMVEGRGAGKLRVGQMIVGQMSGSRARTGMRCLFGVGGGVADRDGERVERLGR